MTSYAGMYRAVEDITKFWLDAAAGIDWVTPPQTGLDRGNPPFYRWFPDGMMNTCYNALTGMWQPVAAIKMRLFMICPSLVARNAEL